MAVVAMAAGAFALLAATVGPAGLLVARGLGHYLLIAASLKSSGLRIICVCVIAVGVLAVILAAAVYRRLDTRIAREEAVVGLVTGLLAVGAGAALIAFTRGNMVVFARNFLNFSDITGPFGVHAFVEGMKNTIELALASGLFGIVIGLLVAVLLISKRAVVRAPARLYVNVIRGTPILLQLSLVYFGFAVGLRINFSSFEALIIGLSINAGAYSAEVFRAGIQSVERGQLEAARGLGLSYMRSLRLVILPQAVRRVIPPLLNEFIGLIKDTSLIAFLGVELGQRDLFSVANSGYTQDFDATFFVAVGLGYLVITLPLIRIVNALEKRMRSGLVGVGS